LSLKKKAENSFRFTFAQYSMKLKKKIKSPAAFLLLLLLVFSFAYKVNSSVSTIKQKQVSLQQKNESETGKSDSPLPFEESENGSEFEDSGLSDQLFTSFLFFEDPFQVLIRPQGTNCFISASILKAGKSEMPVYLSNRTIRV
jgi:hypothetical protein